jgi:hypothetical protein
MGTSNDGASGVTLGQATHGTKRPAAHVDHFTEKDGLPKGSRDRHRCRGVPIFTGGLEEPPCDALSTRRQADSSRQTAFDGVVGVNLNVAAVSWSPTLVDACSSIWAARRLSCNSARTTPGRWTRRRSRDSDRRRSTGLFLDGDIVWLQFADGRLVRYDTAQKPETPPAATVLIRRRRRKPRKVMGTRATPPSLAGVRFKPDENALRFEFALPSLPRRIRHRVSIPPRRFDTDWSAWTHEPQREYTNLSNGAYNFRVHARGISGVVGERGRYTFSVLATVVPDVVGLRGLRAPCSACASPAAARVTRMRRGRP